jgi:hypothetical protein
MKKTVFKKILSAVLCFVLIAAMALTFASCKDNGGQNGEKTFTFTVVDLNGNEKSEEITTNKKYVGEALMEKGIIEGETGDVGLYVKKVNGIVADYDVDGTYWAFYINGEYAMTGVDQTEIKDGETYTFKIEK